MKYSLESFAEPVEVKTWIKSDVESIKNAWISAEQITKWFLTRAEHFDSTGQPVDEAKEGGRYVWTWVEGSQDQAQIIEVSASRFVFGWFEGNGTVTVTWEPDPAGDVLVKIHQEMHDGTLDERIYAQKECHLGWAFFITNLKAWLEHGIDLRETDPTRRGATNV